MKSFPKNHRALLAISAALLANTAWAEPVTAYRWKDASGTVHYEQSPPTGRTYETVHPLSTPETVVPSATAGQAASSPDDASKAFLKEAEEERARKAKARDAATAGKAQAAAACSEARGRLQFLDERPPNRLLIRDASGETKRMDAEQWGAERKLAGDAISKNCVN